MPEVNSKFKELLCASAPSPYIRTGIVHARSVCGSLISERATAEALGNQMRKAHNWNHRNSVLKLSAAEFHPELGGFETK